MVVKTELCQYSEYKIYPGRGMRYVGKDARTYMFLSAKTMSLFHQKIKAAKLTWTQAWRRMNKKGKTDAVTKKKKGKAMKFQKAIVGMTLEEMKRKKNQRNELRAAARDQQVKEAKARVANKSKKPAAPKAKASAAQAKMPNQKQAKGGNNKNFGRKQ